MVRIMCKYDGRTTYTMPMRKAEAISTIGEIVLSGMAPEGAVYRLVDVV